MKEGAPRKRPLVEIVCEFEGGPESYSGLSLCDLFREYAMTAGILSLAFSVERLTIYSRVDLEGSLEPKRSNSLLVLVDV